MEPAAIHRVIEQHAATQPDALAVVDEGSAMTYRDLNSRANACARRLIAAGFRRGAHATVKMPRGEALTVVLLGVLKAGGSYAWIELTREAGAVGSITFRKSSELRSRPERVESPSSDGSEWIQTVAIEELLARANQAHPNLPVVTRGSDIACIVRTATGAELLVPHATVISVTRESGASSHVWEADSGALDLWPVLIAGGTLMTSVGAQSAAAA